ncbi:GGDEF domain-containing protein [Marinomonas sp. GJ51-6]|uniref:GGDEF domain-containing protein n=1 Tax=Marinomonas sp. GJ51-6 TaxID=2992802 RepID=UPI002934867D|nr:GGDEF domain-containing protein [Marinomonas sp. GJ51-6]WOD08534.1 GGDEF domain-containing protein [Marinomonas sp. GJ51-6]
MLDIDKFKAINDAYGHAAGDLVIKSLSELVQRILGKDDWVARMGGEEFLIWLNNATSKDALSLAESIRQQVESLSVKGSESDIQYTVSIGLHVAKELPSFKFKEWVDLADQRLYQAKEAGRNRIVH